jgi:hypothetical protein
MRRLVPAGAAGVFLLLVLSLWSPSPGGPEGRLAVLPLDTALSEEDLSGLRGLPLGTDRVLVEVDGASAGRIEAAGFPVLGRSGGAPLWTSPYSVPEKVLAEAGVEPVYAAPGITVFRAPVNQAYSVLESGYSIARASFVPLSTLTEPSPSRDLAQSLSMERPLSPERLRFMRAVSQEADADSLKNLIYFLNFDSVAGEYRSRFCARYELKNDVTPFIRKRLEKYVLPAGGTVWEQEFIPQIPDYYKGQDTAFVNVIADIPGTKTRGRYIVCGHYDAIAVRDDDWDWWSDPAPGADDNGTGASVVLECARLLSGLDFDFGLTFALFSAEEIGLMGSDYYSGALAAGDTIIGVINVDMIGYVEDIRMTEISYGWKSEWLSRALEETADSLGIETVFTGIERPAFFNSDHASFWKWGIPALMLGDQTEGVIPRPLTPYYHTRGDTLGNVDLPQVTDNVRLVAGFLSRFADLPEDSLPDLVLTPGSVEFDWLGRSASDPLVAGADLTLRIRALNMGGAMDGSRTYEMKVRKGRDGSGPLVHESRVDLSPVSGGLARASATWKTDQGAYGQVAYTVSLLPVEEGVESNLDNNRAAATLLVSPTTTVVENLHVYPNPVENPDEAVITADILTSQTTFAAGYLVEIYDVTGLLLLEYRDVLTDPELVLPLSDMQGAASDLTPGLYILRLRMNIADEIDNVSAGAGFAVVSGPR